MAEWTGYLAAFLTTVCFIPQAIQLARTRDTKAISLKMYSLFSAGVALWFVYGIQLGSPPIIWANGITLLLSLAILVMKIRFG